MATAGVELTTYNMFMILSLTAIIRISVNAHIAKPVIFLADFIAGLRRIEDMLEVQDLRNVTVSESLHMAFELDTHNINGPAKNPVVRVPRQHIRTIGNHVTPETLSLNSAVCYWQEGDSMAVLKSVSLTVSDGELVLVTGPVGCGKSSLLLAILQELPLSQGSISCSGKIAHVPQQAWIFSGTIRENILFQDFPDGDLTTIGERGVLLSGGQRARVDLARAVYADADVYLLDDPLSAVDANVGKHIFEKCICGLLAHKTRIAVTHRQQFLRNAEHIVIMKEGSVINEGSYTTLRKAGVEFQEIFDGNVDQGECTAVRDSYSTKDGIKEEGVNGLDIEEEDRMTGSVSWSLYWKYFRAGLPSLLLIILAVFFVFVQGESVCVILDIKHPNCPIKI